MWRQGEMGKGCYFPVLLPNTWNVPGKKRRGERDYYPVVTFRLVRPPETFYWESPV